MKWILKTVGLITLPILMSSSLIAQSFKARFYTESDGLPSSTVYDMAQDHQGRMWFATRSGIACYDGIVWKTYDHENGLPVQVFYQIRVDRYNRVWAATRFHQQVVFYLDGEQWHPLDTTFPLLNGRPLSLQLTDWGGKTVLALAQKDDGFYLKRDQVWQKVTSDDGLTCLDVRSLSEWRGHFYLATDTGLFIVGPKGVDARLNQYLAPEMRNLYTVIPEEQTGSENPRIWLVGEESVALLEEGRCRLLTSHRLGLNRRLTGFADGRGGFFFGNDFALHFVRRDGQSSMFGPKNGLISNGVFAFMKDREHSLWIAGARGVTKFPSRRFSNWSQKHGLAEDETSAVTQMAPGSLLVGNNQALHFINGEKVTTIPVQRDEAEDGLAGRVMDLRPDGKGGAWAALTRLGVAHIDDKLNLKRYPLPGKLVFSLIPAGGIVWLGTEDGLFKWEQGFITKVSQSSYLVRRLIQGEGSRIYIATSKDGLLAYGPDMETEQKVDPDLKNIFAGHLDQQSRLWIGAASGLYQRRDDQLVPTTVDGTLLKRTVYAITDDLKGRLWVGTDRGIHRFDGHQWRHYGSVEGLPGLEINRGGLFCDSKGAVWVGNDGGVSQYLETYDVPEIPSPNLYLEHLYTGEETYDLNTPLLLTHDQNDLSFDFRIISFIDETDFTYSVRLKGYDREWLKPSRNRSHIRYTSLPPGEYVFQVKGANAMDIWSEAVSSAPIRIQRPYWRKWWFRGLLALALTGLLFSAFDYATSKRNSRVLEELVRTRTQEIQALNDDLEERVHQRTISLEAAQKDLIESAHFAGMAEIATSMLHNVGNILNSIITSGYLLKETLETSKYHSLIKANSLLKENLHDVTHFLTQDPKGRRLIEFYLSLGDAFGKEHQKLTKNTKALLEKLDTIKDVVAQQHNYASGVRQVEMIDLVLMADTAVKISEASFVNKGITLERNYASVPKKLVQKTKLIHILVNLIKNAVDSIVLSNKKDGIISVRVEGNEATAFITVTDNGSGIEKENLPLIFRHGFTTKQEGHGFGLHNCANAMAEMGGSIWAESDGEGQGATFVLQFNSQTD